MFINFFIFMPHRGERREEMESDSFRQDGSLGNI